MRCLKHTADVDAHCNWCGKGLCPKCERKRDNKLLYCVECAGQIAPLKKQAIRERVHTALQETMRGDVQ